MTLSDFVNLHFANNIEVEPTFLIFEDERSFEDYHTCRKSTPDITISCIYQLSQILRPEWANAEVLHFSAAGQDKVEIIMDIVGGK